MIHFLAAMRCDTFTKNKLMKKNLIIFTLFVFCAMTANMASAQAPAGKYNITDYPEDRKAIEAIRTRPDSLQHLNDDYIAVGPEGKISYGLAQWKKGFADNKATFKSVTPVPGMYILRIYNGDAAVSFNVLDVVFTTPKGDISIRVIRTETYIKQNGQWYFVSGQGTRSMSKEEFEATLKN